MTPSSDNRVVLITGAAQRIGAHVADVLHHAGFNIVVHYHHSQKAAEILRDNLNGKRVDSCKLVQGDLTTKSSIETVAVEALNQFGRIDALINNASAFYPTPIGTATETQWRELMGTNLETPFFLTQKLAGPLREHNGAIINMVDIYAESPLGEYPIYCAAKAGLVALTKSLAKELAPEIRVNGIAPGVILWPEGEDKPSREERNRIIQKIPLQRAGSPEDIARTIRFLLLDAPYITGQVIAVDGGKSL